jgi:two-component system, OmpR family, response regulator
MRNRRPKILIVDDEKSFTQLTRLTLADYEICEENNSARALETARQFRPDLILLDVVMPDFDGGDIAAQLRADPIFRRVPIIFLTAIVTEKETEKRQLFGGYPFIAKPVTPERLAENIEKYLAASS